jgi:hypothetical protein
VLRITTVAQSPAHVTLKLEGRMVADWVSLVERECLRWLQDNHTVCLDVSAVTFIEARGVEMLKRRASAHLHLINASVLIQELLR